MLIIIIIYSYLDLNMQAEQRTNYDIIIIGAGAAGIAAAKKLQEQNLSYLILEATERIGGRMTNIKICNTHIDLGACWIHSFTKKNPLYKYINKYKWKQKKQSIVHHGRQLYDGEKGGLIDHHILIKAQINASNFYKQCESRVQQIDEDVSLYEAVGSQFVNQVLSKQSAEEKRVTQLILNMTEHYQASSLKELSAKKYEYRLDQGGDFDPEQGYTELLRKIGEGIKVEFNKKVIAISKAEGVHPNMIHCQDGSVYQSKALLVSLPLGVFKRNCVKFSPQLPEEHQRAINRLGFGLMNKIIMSFKHNFWGNCSWVSIAFDEKGKFPHMYNFSNEQANILCCFVTDDFAWKIETLSDQQIITDMLSSLKKAFPGKQDKIDILEYHVTRWGKNELSYGSYTAFHVGSSEEDCYTLRKPIEERMWLIGEHCYAEHIGTAHGAFQTGEWAAQQAILSLKKPVAL